MLAVLYLFPALYLLRYAQAIKWIGSSNPSAMEEALAQQASFWRFVGILIALLTGLYVVVIAAAVVVAVIGATAGS